MVKKVRKVKSDSSIDIRKTNIFDIKKEVAADRLKKIRANANRLEKRKNVSDHFTECSARSEEVSERLFNLTLDSDSDSELTDNTNEMFEQIYQRAEEDEDPTFDEISSLSSDTVDPIDNDEDYPLPYDEIDIYFADPESFTEPEKIEDDSAFSIRLQLFDEIRGLPDFNVLKIKYLVLEEIRLFDRSRLKPAIRSHWIRYFKSFFY